MESIDLTPASYDLATFFCAQRTFCIKLQAPYRAFITPYPDFNEHRETSDFVEISAKV